MLRFTPFLLALLLILSSPSAAETLDSIAQIRALTPEQAARGLPVAVEALVTFHNPARPSLLAYDGKEGIYVTLPEGGNEKYLPGTRLRIEGVTRPDGFLPILEARRLEILGSEPLPQPRRIDASQLFSPSLDCQWVQIPAIITGLEEGEHMVLLAEVSGWSVKLLLPSAGTMQDAAAELMQRPVTITGVVGTVFNAQRQLTGRHFFIPSLDRIVPSESTVPDGQPMLRPINELLRSDATSRTRVRVRAVVTHATADSLYLRGEGGSLQVRTTDTQGLRPGTLVEAEGFATVAPFRPMLRATAVTALEENTVPPQPHPLTLENPLPTALQSELVTIDAECLGRRDGPATQVTLNCRSGDRFFEAVLNEHPDGPGAGANDRVRLTGIAEFTSSRELPFNDNADGFRLHLRSANDVAILQRAPWWTLRRMFWALGIAGAFSLVSLAWVALLRRKVAKQTRIIGAQIQRAAVKDERQRIARELHDTIEQELAGISLQIRNARQRSTQSPELAGASFELAERMLRHCREEARSSIRDLRSVTLEQRGLVGALEEFLEPIAVQCGARFSFEVEGEPQPLAGPVEVHLLRIANEAVANAARHASPDEIRVWLSYGRDAVTLEIRDDGCGFNPSTPALRGHFGLMGIQERANKLNAALAVESAPGAGTCVRVMVRTGAGVRADEQLV